MRQVVVPSHGRTTVTKGLRRVLRLYRCALVTFVTALQPAWAEYRKEAPIAVIVAAEGSKFIPAGTRTPLTSKPGVFLFAGDTLNGTGNGTAGATRILWCPENASRKFEYTLTGTFALTLSATPPTLPGGKELDLCRLPALERSPEVATLPSLSEIVPAPLPAGKVEEAVADTPPDTAAALTAMARRDLSDPGNRLTYAVSLAAAGLIDPAIDQYAELARLWPEQPRLGRLILDLRQTGSTREIVHPQPARTEPSSPAAAGKMYALVIGIKDYEQDGVPNLLFADADAAAFAKFIASERGGKAEVVTLLNQQARVSAIRNHMTDLLAKLRKDDTLVLFVAAHGDMRGDMPIVVTYRANSQDTSINGLPLNEIQKLRFGEKAPFRQVRVFLDICHGGNIALIDPPGPRGRPVSPPAPPREFLFFTATHQGPDAFAYEDPKFGHGVFTYFLLRGLAAGEARDTPDDRYITAGGLSRFVETWVQRATTSTKDGKPRQKPTSLLGVALGREIADLTLPGPAFTDTRPLASMVVPAERLGRLRRQAPVRKQPEPGEPDSNSQEVDRRIALEDEGESILLKYLEGDEVPQQREDFARGARAFGDALALRPGSPYLEARMVFCEGRVSVFNKNYDEAIVRLERAILLDPGAAYAYNALGIAYLERGDYGVARMAFEDAIQRAPKWAYPRHNLALVHTQAGNYEDAIAGYQDAKQRAPDYFYLPYNLGLLFQRMNRLEEAEAEYQTAARNAGRNAPGRSEPLIALGLLKASQRKWRDAERYYRSALQIPAAELSRRTGRHNLAVLLARNERGWAEAEQLWRENGAYVPSQLALAQAYAWKGRTREAIEQLREVLRAVPDHLSARMQLAAEVEKGGDRQGAISELRTAAGQQPDNPAILERLAALLALSGSRAEALELYRSAIARTADSVARGRMRKAVQRLEKMR
jgi:tetratricopeptide (TPR) repeat protein